MRPTLLARLCDLEAPVISRELRGLEAADLVRRFADPTDGRASLIEIMPDGRATSLRYRAAVDEIIDETFAAWTAADLKALAVYLERVVVDFSKPRAPQGRGATPERKS